MVISNTLCNLCIICVEKTLGLCKAEGKKSTRHIDPLPLPQSSHSCG